MSYQNSRRRWSNKSSSRIGNRRHQFTALSLATLAGSLAASAAHAQTNLYWDGEATGYDNVQNVNGASNGGTGFWNTTSADWDNGTAEVVWPNTASTVAVFGGAISGRVYQAGSNLIVGGMTFQVDGFAVDSGTLNLGQYGITTTANGTAATQDATVTGEVPNTSTLVSSAINLTASQTWTVTNSADLLTVSGVIADTTGFTLTKAGAGTLVLSGINTYTGGTTINAGTLTLNNGGGAGAVRGVITVNSGATLNLAVGDALGYNNDGTQVTTVNVNGGTVTSAAANEGYLTSYNLTGGTVAAGGFFRFNVNAATPPGITSLASGTTSTFAADIDDYPGSNTAGNLVINVAKGTTASGVDLEFSGAISSSGTAGLAGITKTGTGSLDLSNENTFGGPVTISAGTLNVGVQGADDGGGGALGLSNTGKTITVSAGATLSGTVNNWFGNQTNTDANLPTITVNGGTLSTTRYTTIGALNLNGATVTNSVTQDAGNYQSFAFRGNVTVTGTAPSTITSTTVTATTGGYHLGANTTFTVASTGSATADLTFSAPLLDQSGDFANAPGGLTKAGPGAMLLTSINTYTGATVVNAGTLLVNGSTAAASAVTVTGAVLGGTGTVSGATTIGTGSKITGGTVGTVGTLTLQSTVTVTGGTYAVDISGATADKLTISGVLALTNANITFTGTPTAPSYVLATFASETGTFSGTAPSGYSFQFNAGGTELDLVSAVPEPSTWMIVGMLVAATGVYRRRQIADWLGRARV